MTEQTLRISCPPEDAILIRKSLVLLKHYRFESGEVPGANNAITFVITSEEPLFFYMLGKHFGTMKEFNSKK
jgi:hypothetical protein